MYVVLEKNRLRVSVAGFYNMAWYDREQFLDNKEEYPIDYGDLEIDVHKNGKKYLTGFVIDPREFIVDYLKTRYKKLLSVPKKIQSVAVDTGNNHEILSVDFLKARSFVVDGMEKDLIFPQFCRRKGNIAIQGFGVLSMFSLILQKNTRAGHADGSNKIPLDAETRRNLAAFGLDYGSVPRKGKTVQVRLTSNYHTGGSVAEITESVSADLVREAQKIARLFDVPVLGVDFLVNSQTGRHWVIELSPDLAISPPEGEKVARYFLDYLFPETKGRPAGQPRLVRTKRRTKPAARFARKRAGKGKSRQALRKLK